MKLSGGIVVFIISNKVGNFYYGENSNWLMDDWKGEVDDGSYIKIIEDLKIDLSMFSEEMKIKNQPKLIIDIDHKKVFNSYYDQVLEKRIPGGWEGVWVDKMESLFDRIPLELHYWKKEEST